MNFKNPTYVDIITVYTPNILLNSVVKTIKILKSEIKTKQQHIQGVECVYVKIYEMHDRHECLCV